MAARHRSLVQYQIADVTECSICTEIFTNPKILPCVHTFCLHCLEKYGKDKKPGNQMVCPMCKKEFLIPVGGFFHLPDNFFIGKVVEIGKLAMTPTNKALCALCPEDEDVFAEMFCADCGQNLCSRCTNGHRKSRFSQHHQVVKLGSELNSSNINLRNSYCDHHPGEQLKMFCYVDNVVICLICCVESHQSHRCVNVNKAAAEFVQQLRYRAGKVANRLSECVEFGETLDKFKKEFKEEVLKTEEGIRDAGKKMIQLIAQNQDQLVQKLKLVRERNDKAFDITKQEIDRFRVMIDSYARYSEELLTRGSPVDICRDASQLLTRAQELETLPANCSGDCFYCDTIVFNPPAIENLLRPFGLNNAVGELTVTRSSDWLLKFDRETSVICSIASTQHHFEKKDVKVEPYDPWLCLTSACESNDKVPAKTESNIRTSSFFSFDSRAVHFILKRQELQRYIEDHLLKKFNCHIEWPSSGKGDVKLEFNIIEKQKPASGWDVECKKVLQRYADELTWKKENIRKELWNDFKKKITEHAEKIIQLIDVAFENDKSEIQYIGLKKDTDELKKMSRKIKWELEEELVQRKTRIPETATNLEPHQLGLIRTEEFKKNLRQKLPDLKFEEIQTEVNLCGMKDVVKRARLYPLLGRVPENFRHSFDISESMSKVFAKNDARSYLTELLLCKGISASWVCNDKRVVIFAVVEKNVKKAAEVLKNEVVEARLKLSAVNLSKYFCQSPQWKIFIRCLCTEDKLLELDADDSFITVACMRSSIEKKKRRIEDFISRNSTKSTFFFSFEIQDKWQ